MDYGEQNKLDVLARLTEDMRKVLDIEAEMTQKRVQDRRIDHQARDRYSISREYWNEGGPKMEKTLDAEMEGPHGDLPFRIYYPEKKTHWKGILYFHGGGFTVGSVETHDGICRRLAAETGAAVISVEYRLAPEHKFPVPVDEAVQATRYFAEKGMEYGIDPSHLSLAGDSAGGYLALAAPLQLRDQGRDIGMIRTLLLFYGSFGMRDSFTRRLFGGHWDGLGKKNLEGYAQAFMPENATDFSFFDLFQRDLTQGLPPVCLVGTDVDPLLDDSRTLYAILREHGLSVDMKTYTGVIHGFLHYAHHLPESGQAIRYAADFYRSHGA